MLSPEQIPQNYSQPLAQLLQERKQQGAMPMGQPVMQQQPGSPQGQQPQQQLDPMAGIQSISKLLGYQPNTTFGYDMSSMAPPAQGPMPDGSITQNPSMNGQQATQGQGIMQLLGSILAMA